MEQNKEIKGYAFRFNDDGKFEYMEVKDNPEEIGLIAFKFKEADRDNND